MSIKTKRVTPMAMPRCNMTSRICQYPGDLQSPVGLYMRLRDHYSEPVLLESNNFGSLEDSHSYLGLDVLAQLRVEQGELYLRYPGMEVSRRQLVDPLGVPDRLQAFLDSFDIAYPGPRPDFDGLLGHVSYEGVQYFDSLQFDPAKRKVDIPELRFSLYRFLISFDHFRDRYTVIEHIPEGEESRLHELERFMRSARLSTFGFQRDGEETSNLTDEEFMKLVERGKYHCQQGDVFQIVFSRQFAQRFRGDEFQVYRVLRSINPSPYLFYFDCGEYKIIGSSPEAQMRVQSGVASVNPIAGTYRRSGDKSEDARRAMELSKDPKENAEHIMLVDLARNDLSRHAANVRVSELQAVQFYSHVIHLVSTVKGDLREDTSPVQVFADTFPAGTLSGAPKYRALELIGQYENQNRGSYGGSIGMLDFNGHINQAIVIRSFLSKNQTLYYQAGAGIVVDSVPEKELQEVNNKLGALTKALNEAEAL